MSDKKKRVIDLRQIVKRFYIGQPNELEILHKIDLSVEEGEFISIVGESGSGKTTLMNIIGALDRPTGGEYYLEGMDVCLARDKRLSELRNQKIGFIFQTYNLIARTTALSNVELPMLYAGVTKAERMARAQELLAMVGMEDRMQHRPDELSGGQKQRVAIARAMANDPAILLADEPTGSVALVQHYPKQMPVIFPSLSTFISSMTDRQRVRFSSRVKVSYIALKSAVKIFLMAAKSGGASCAGSGSFPSAAVYIS